MAGNKKFTPGPKTTLGTLIEDTEATTEEEKNMGILDSIVSDAGNKEDEEKENFDFGEAENSSVSFSSEEPTKGPVSMVTVRTNCNHRCNYGGTWYDFQKGVNKKVPEEVKKVLLDSNLLMPL